VSASTEAVSEDAGIGSISEDYPASKGTIMGAALVHVEGFRMDFGGSTVIRNLSFDVQAGETFGFLGSNGSGKTTTIRALLGIYKPTAGVLHINGKSFSPEDGGRLGYLPEERGLYKKENVIELMTHFGRLKGFDRNAAKSWSLQYLERVALADKAKKSTLKTRADAAPYTKKS
jgi:ABC-2 type transport system ATP-binding protein